MLEIIVAVDENGGFGKDGKIPWHYKQDFAHFKNITSNHVCVMGRKTYQDMLGYATAQNRDTSTSILPKRQCFVLTSTLSQIDCPGATIVSNLQTVKDLFSPNNKIIVLGGQRIYIQALPSVSTIHMTVVPGVHNCDRFFPVDYVNKHFVIDKGEQCEVDNGTLKFITYRRN